MDKQTKQTRATQVRALDERAKALFASNSHVSTLCPVVLCPYLCASDSTLTNVLCILISKSTKTLWILISTSTDKRASKDIADPYFNIEINSQRACRGITISFISTSKYRSVIPVSEINTHLVALTLRMSVNIDVGGVGGSPTMSTCRTMLHFPIIIYYDVL